jgi:hypothetical protein
MMNGVAPFVVSGTNASDLIEVSVAQNPLQGPRLTVRINSGVPMIKLLAPGQGVNVKGLRGNDSIVIRGSYPVNANGGSGNDALLGGSGNDTLHGGIGADRIEGGAGADQLFGGLDDDTLRGGDGEDVLVSVFGGTGDRLFGNAGWDNFVADDDSTEVIVDPEPIETRRRSINRIARFANPTVAGMYPVYASELGVSNITDPALHGRATGWANFSHIPLFTPSGPRMTDVQQQGLGDCWLAAPAAGIAGSSPWHIRRAVMPLGDGTYMVRLGNQAFRVDADLPVRSDGSCAYGNARRPGGDSLWFPLLEKAMAYQRHQQVPNRPNARFYTYESTHDDLAGRAHDALGLAYDRYTLNYVATSVNEMWDHVVRNAGKAMSICTLPDFAGVGTGLEPRHCYSITGTYISASGKRMVVLRNPWAGAEDGRVAVSASNLHGSSTFMYIGVA